MYSPAQSPQGYNTTPATPYQPTQHAPELSPYQSPNQIPQPSPYSPQSPQSPPGPHNSRGMADYSQQSPQPLLSPAHQHHGPPSDGLAPGKWHESYCGCCSPFDLCCVTWWCPCFTFGKTHHRLRAGNNMERYETCNSSVCPLAPQRPKNIWRLTLLSQSKVLDLLWSDVLRCPLDTDADAEG